MDPLTALSIATAVTQFIDFASKLLSIGYNIYHSPEGKSTDSLKVEEVYEKLSRTSQKLAAIDTEQGLQDLAKKCKSICDEILKIVGTAQMNGSKSKVWASARAAVKEMLGRRKIEELERDVKITRDLLSLELQSILQQQINDHGAVLRSLKEDSRKLGLQQSSKLDAIARGIENLKLDLKSPSISLGISRQAILPQSIKRLQENIEKIQSASAKARREQAILGTLHFDSLPRRHNAIRDAHEETFKWIYESSFTQWLNQTHTGIFWITGKPGSGKSTLMKFIADNAATKRIFTNAIQPQQAIFASHYFWNGGSEMQKSLTGLLQTLVFEVFKQQPSSIPIVSPARWDTCLEKDYTQPWTVSELISTLCDLGRTQAGQAQICIFIDGIDEFGYDHFELCNILKGLVESPSIKLCVSSRPWNVFEDFFGNDRALTIAIHHHTKDDIRKFARSQLETHPRWAHWFIDGGDKNMLIDEITNRAEGVFLWAFLVIKDLKKGITDDDTLPDLQRKLNSLPSDLEHLFKHILESVEVFHHEQMARMLCIALYAHHPLRWEIFHYHGLEYDNNNFAIEKPIEIISKVDNFKKYDKTRRRIGARTKGLLEICGSLTQDGLKHVDFLHRTVRDFLCTSDMTTYLQGKLNHRFDAALSICRAHLAFIKSTCFIGGKEASPGGENFDQLIKETLRYTHSIPNGFKDEMVRTIDDLEKSVIVLAKQRYALSKNNIRRPRKFFISLVLEEDAAEYLSHKARQDTHYLSSFELPALVLALQGTPPPMRTLAFLLESGESPNRTLNDFEYATPWCYLVQESCGWGQSTSSEALDIALREGIFTMFLNHGANPNYNALTTAGHRFSTFAMFLLTYLRNSWRTVDPDQYIATFKEFMSAGADLNDTIVLPPYNEMGGLSWQMWPEPEFKGGVSEGNTIKEMFSRQSQRLLSLSLSQENTASVRRVVDIVSAAY